MPRFYTVIPIYNVDLDPQEKWEFGGSFVLAALPDWLREQPMLEHLNESDREALEVATHGFIVTYEAAAFWDPDPEWKGPEPKSIPITKYEQAILANLSLWLSRPCPVHFINILHAAQFNGEPEVLLVGRCSRLLCHPKDEGIRITAGDFTLAARLHKALLTITRDTAMWTAVRATWSGLQTDMEEPIRYALFWIGLEALFGPEDAREITYRLSQRVAFFLSEDRNEAKQLFATAKKGYGFRSKIVHGRWKKDKNSEQLMAETESMVRRSLVRILEDPELTKTFSERGRERFLDHLVFKNG
jgi:hypothetical protein